MMYDPYAGPNKRPRPDEYPGMAVDPHAQAAPVGYGAPPVAGYHPGYDERAAAAANAAYYGGAAAAAWGRGYQRIFTCVRLRGLPFQATETDVIDFLARWGCCLGGGRPPAAAAACRPVAAAAARSPPRWLAACERHACWQRASQRRRPRLSPSPLSLFNALKPKPSTPQTPNPQNPGRAWSRWMC